MTGFWTARGDTSMRTGGAGGRPAIFAQMEGYWQALRPASGDLPRRADFDPRGIADLLECTLLLERIAPGQVRIRLAGMATCDLLGMDLRGMPLSALVVPDARAALSQHLEQVFDGPAIATLRLAGDSGMLRPKLAASLLILPMRGSSGAVDRALACLALEGSIGRSPRRFALLQGACRPVPGLAVEAAPKRRDAVQPGLAEAPAAFAPAPKGKPVLRLIKGGAA